MCDHEFEQSAEAHRGAGQQRDVGHHVVDVLDHDERARAERDRADHAQVEYAVRAMGEARRARDECERERDEQRTREPRRIVQRHHALQQPREARRDPRVERRLFHERLARIGRHDEIAGLQHVLDDAECIGLVLLPRVVAEHARQRVRTEHDRGQQPGAPAEPREAAAAHRIGRGVCGRGAGVVRVGEVGAGGAGRTDVLSRGGHGRASPAGRGGSRHGKGSRVDRAGPAADGDRQRPHRCGEGRTARPSV